MAHDNVGRIGVILGVIGMAVAVMVALSACSPIFWPGGAIVLEVFNG